MGKRRRPPRSHLLANDQLEGEIRWQMPTAGSWAEPVRAAMLQCRSPTRAPVQDRVHVDLVPTHRTREEEVKRLLELGHTLVEEHGDAAVASGCPGWPTQKTAVLWVEVSAAKRAPTGRPSPFALPRTAEPACWLECSS